jgi:hypothetical protein
MDTDVLGPLADRGVRVDVPAADAHPAVRGAAAGGRARAGCSRVCPQEGNMRVASLISSIPLMRHKIPPVLVPKSLRKEYYDALHKVCRLPCARCVCWPLTRGRRDGKATCRRSPSAC